MKKLQTVLKSKAFIFLLGIGMTFSFYTAYAAISSRDVSSGELLTADMWNKMVADLRSLEMTVSDEYNCDQTRNNEETCVMGAHQVCFLTAAHGNGNDDNDCSISGSPSGDWSIYAYVANDPFIHCRARCLN